MKKKACLRWTVTSDLRNEEEYMFTLDSDGWPS